MRKKHLIDNLHRAEARIKELEELICPARQHQWFTDYEEECRICVNAGRWYGLNHMKSDDLISRSALLEDIDFDREAAKVHPREICERFNRFCDYAEELVNDAPAVDAEPVRHGKCALCRIKETGHGIIAFYKVGWQACITKRDEGYFMVIGHEGDQVGIPVDFCPNCGAKMK